MHINYARLLLASGYFQLPGPDSLFSDGTTTLHAGRLNIRDAYDNLGIFTTDTLLECRRLQSQGIPISAHLLTPHAACTA